MTITPKQLEEALNRGAKAARALGPATDALNATLGRIERALEEMGLGVEDEVLLYPGQPLHSGPWLRFSQTGEGWGFSVRYGDGTPTPLANASREDRLAAVEVLPSLIVLLTAAADRKHADVASAAGRAGEILAQIRGPRGVNR